MFLLTFHTEKEWGSTTVGCTTSLPGNTPQVTAFTSDCPTLLRTCNHSPCCLRISYTPCSYICAHLIARQCFAPEFIAQINPTTARDNGTSIHILPTAASAQLGASHTANYSCGGLPAAAESCVSHTVKQMLSTITQGAGSLCQTCCRQLTHDAGDGCWPCFCC